MSRKWEGQQNPGRAARKEPRQRGFRQFRVGPPLPESSPEPHCLIFFTVLGFLIHLVIKFPGLQQIRRGCCSWKQAPGPGEATSKAAAAAAEKPQQEERSGGRGQASCLSGTAALAPAIGSFRPRS